MRALGWIIAAGLVAQPVAGAAADLRPDQQAFFGLYKELVETNTVVDIGSCTQATAQIAARMKAAGYSDSELTPFSVPDHPKDGGLVATLKGSDPKAKPMLLLAHIDVVAAKREDWVRDPFKLIEENGFYYGRGTVDDKAMAAIWADSMIRFKASGYKPKRTIKLALTCGEETTYAFNGAQWLAANKRDLIAAEFALNEGGGGRYNAKGERELLAIQVGEKAAQNFTFTTTNPGGHSSQPVPDNAIYELADALEKVRGYEFPVKFTDRLRQLNTRSASNAAKAKIIATLTDLVPALAEPIFGTLADRKIDLTALVKDDDALAEHIRQNVAGMFHVAGTCRMGASTDRDAVVDRAGRVRGFDGLRVVDASIMPTVPRANTNIPTIMIAEKISAAMTAGQ